MAVLARIRGFPGLEDLEVCDGEVVRLVGPNGGGKTSLLRALAGLEAPLAPASVEVEGQDPRRLPAPQRRSTADLVFQSPRDGLVGLTVAGEARMRGIGLALPLPADQDVATLSQGESRRLALAVAGAGAGRLLLLDEPAEGLDDAGMRHLRDLVEAGRRRGAVVLVDHDGRLAAAADRSVVVGDAGDAGPPRLPAPDGGVQVDVAAGIVVRGERRIRCPSWRGQAGLHVVQGPNGCGKTTWLMAIAGLLPGVQANVGGRRPEPGRDVRMLLPGPYDHFQADTVAQELDGAEQAVVEALVPSRLLRRHPLTLSGGEARRVASAKVLGRPAPLLLLDEPEAHLDAAGRTALWGILAGRIAQGACVMAASHDPGVQAAAHSRIAWEGP